MQRAKNNGDLDDLGVIDSSGEVTSVMPPVGKSNGEPAKQQNRAVEVGDERLVQRLEALQKTNETLTKQVGTMHEDCATNSAADLFESCEQFVRVLLPVGFTNTSANRCCEIAEFGWIRLVPYRCLFSCFTHEFV